MSSSAIEVSLGPIELGILAASLLCGVMIVQCYTYYQVGFGDGRVLKLFVVFVLLIELFHTGLLWAYLYNETVTRFGDHASMTEDGQHWTLRVSNPITSVMTWAVQGFFAIRVYRLSRRAWYTIISCMLCSVHLAGGFAILVLTGRHTIAQFASEFRWLLIANWSLTAVIDVGNTTALCYCLIKARTGSVVKQSQSMIDKLILWTIETGLLTSIVVIVMIILVVSLPSDNFAFMFLYCMKAKLYSNSLLASLNNRKCLREQNARDWPIQLSTARSFPDFAQQLDVRVDVVESRFVDQNKHVPDADGKADFDVGSRMHRSASFSHEV